MFVEVSCASSVETVLIVRDSGAGADFDLMAIGERERERDKTQRGNCTGLRRSDQLLLDLEDMDD